MILYCLYATAFVVVSYLWFGELPATKRRWRSINLDARLGRFSQSMEDLWKGKDDDWWWEQYLEDDKPHPPRGKTGTVKFNPKHDEGIHIGEGCVLYPNEMRLVMMGGLGQEYDTIRFEQLPTGESRVDFIDDGSIRTMEFDGNMMINTSRKDPRIAPAWD